MSYEVIDLNRSEYMKPEHFGNERNTYHEQR